ncbi:MAG: phenylacetate--CoA ligase [Lentisphaerae bacterium]|nr:phenylacetate--CoA ligase [Lentisphaerota bacterium]
MKTKFELKDDISFLPAAEIRKEQDCLLAEHIRYCRENSPFYRKRFAGFDPDKVFDYDSLQELPTTSKSDLAEHNEEFFAVPEEQIADICFTSGTTGNPCRIVYSAGDLDRLGYNDAVGFKAAGMVPTDKVLLTCTIDRCFIAGLAYYQGVVKVGASAVRNGLNTIASHASILSMVHPEGIVGVPSFIAKLGQYLKDNGIDGSCVKRIVCIGEPIRTRDMKLTPLGQKLEEFWPGAVHSTYASSEIVTSFTECSARCGGHPPADLAIVEILDEKGNRVPDGVTGEVTVTPLQVSGMPLVRFRTGDISFIIPEKCSCGRNTLRLGPILGRKAQMLKVHGTTLFPGAFFNVLDGIDGVSEYYMEVSGSALSDEISMFVACKAGHTVESLNIREQLYNRTRIHVPVIGVSEEDARKRVFGVSRKPVRFFDLRKE